MQYTCNVISGSRHDKATDLDPRTIRMKSLHVEQP